MKKRIIHQFKTKTQPLTGDEAATNRKRDNVRKFSQFAPPTPQKEEFAFLPPLGGRGGLTAKLKGRISRAIAALLLAATALLTLLLVPTGAMAVAPDRRANRLGDLQVTIVHTVTTTADSGSGSLRQALIDAQPYDIITFDPAVFPPTAPATITLQSQLPDIITASLTIDGSNAGVILDGNEQIHDGLRIYNATRVGIYGLQIVNFSDYGIILIGENTTQTKIGGTQVGQGNLISHNHIGVYLTGVMTNTIQGNDIGNNSQWGIYITGSLGNQVEDNTVSDGFGLGGIFICEGSSYNQVRGNTVSGNSTGIIIQSSYNNRIESNNTISDNGSDGIYITSGSYNRVISNTISGNGGHGINIAGDYNQVEGNNTISGNGRDGIAVVGTRNLIKDNRIGLPIDDRRQEWGNMGYGINIVGSESKENRIENNEVGYNYIAAQLPVGNSLVDNNFFNNQYNEIEIVGGTLYTNTIWSRQGDLNTYLVINKDIQVASGITWIVEEGVNTQFDFGRMAVISGALMAKGSQALPVRFTGPYRFNYPLPGDWEGLQVNSGGVISLTHAHIEFARNGLTQNGGQVDMTSGAIVASAEDGILAQAGADKLNLNHIALAGNGNLAIDNLTDTPIVAEDIWWGHSNGPNNDGDRISGNAQATHWLADPGVKSAWLTAPVLNFGTHRFTIDDEQDIHWFRVPVATRNTVLSATLSHPSLDIDIFAFYGLEKGAASPDDVGHIQGVGHLQGVGEAGNCDLVYFDQLADISQSNSGNLLQAGCLTGAENERIEIDTRDQSGWYYLLVAGHNGANNSTQSYTLDLHVDSGDDFSPDDFTLPDFTPLVGDIYTETKTLILAYPARFGGVPSALMSKLDDLAAAPEVSGQVIDLGSFSAIKVLYDDWDTKPTSVIKANRVAAAIKALLDSRRKAYPNLENIVIVGGDNIIPFYRIPDEVALANESSYQDLRGDYPLSIALKEQYFLTDNYYGSINSLPWRGRGLYLPEYAIGRLVETPEEIIKAIDTFLRQPVLTAATGLATGYDFLQDLAVANQSQMAQKGLNVDILNNDYWTVNDLKQEWLEKTPDLCSLNAHFTHRRLIPAERQVGGDLTAEEVRDSNNLAGSIIFSVGCHSGLVVTDSLDFAQALVGQGATYIANTGYAYGDPNAIGYSERLMSLFTQNLLDGQSAGQALNAAKSDYINTTGRQSLTPYDEKIVNVAGLYGLPMYRANLPARTRQAVQRAASNEKSWQIDAPTSCGDNLTCRSATFTPAYETYTITGTIVGAYYSIEGQTQTSPGWPIQPRNSIDITLAGKVARGAIFEGGKYDTMSSFDPVISQVRAEDLRLEAGVSQTEPAYDLEGWNPAVWDAVNSLHTPTGLEQQLALIPAQYWAKTHQIGIERRFSEMRYTLYYAQTKDIIPPSVWQVQTEANSTDTVIITVQATDLEGVTRVAVAYTTGDGVWQTKNLTLVGNNSWRGELPYHPNLEYFVQALDKSGNVTVRHNKGRYFPFYGENDIYLPVVTKN